MADFLTHLNERRAEKSFGPVADVKEFTSLVEQVKTAMQLAPSSFGIQPYHIVSVRSEDIKTELFPASYNQPQVKECHTLLVVCARNDIPQRAEEYIQAAGLDDATAAFYRRAMLGQDVHWAARQAYIALGFGLAACADMKLSSCPMEGFDTHSVKKILDLPENLVPLVYLAIGGDSGKPHPYPKFRFEQSDLFSEK